MASRKPAPHKGTARAAPKPTAEAVSALEWISGAVGLMLLLGLLALLGRDVAAGQGGPPRLLVEAQSVTAGPHGFIVSVEVRNLGGAAAAAVEVEGVLRPASGEAERASVTFDQVPKGSARHGGLIFASDPRRGQLRLRPLGYVAP